jgi:hypothetical protein
MGILARGEHEISLRENGPAEVAVAVADPDQRHALVNPGPLLDLIGDETVVKGL